MGSLLPAEVREGRGWDSAWRGFHLPAWSGQTRGRDSWGRGPPAWVSLVQWVVGDREAAGSGQITDHLARLHTVRITDSVHPLEGSPGAQITLTTYPLAGATTQTATVTTANFHHRKKHMATIRVTHRMARLHLQDSSSKVWPRTLGWQDSTRNNSRLKRQPLGKGKPLLLRKKTWILEPGDKRAATVNNSWR